MSFTSSAPSLESRLAELAPKATRLMVFATLAAVGSAFVMLGVGIAGQLIG